MIQSYSEAKLDEGDGFGWTKKDVTSFAWPSLAVGGATTGPMPRV